MFPDNKMIARWLGDEFWGGPYNFEPEVTDRPEMVARVQIHDSTLRDGEQNPGVVFRSQEKVAVAKMLDEVVVDQIDMMSPIVLPEEEKAIRAMWILISMQNCIAVTTLEE